MAAGQGGPGQSSLSILVISLGCGGLAAGNILILTASSLRSSEDEDTLRVLFTTTFDPVANKKIKLRKNAFILKLNVSYFIHMCIMQLLSKDTSQNLKQVNFDQYLFNK